MLPGRCEKKEEKMRNSDSGVSLDVVLDAPGGQITGRLHEQYAAAVEDQRADDVHPEEERQIRCKSCAVDAGDGAARASSRSVRRAVRMSRKPRRAYRRANSRPMPEEAPVIHTVLDINYSL